MTFALVMVECEDGDNFYLRGSSKIKLKHLYTKHIANVNPPTSQRFTKLHKCTILDII